MIPLRAQGIFWTALLLGLTLLSGCAVQRGYEAALVLADIAAGNRPSRLKECTPEAERIGFPLVTAARTFAADLYLPGERSRATVLLIPGAAEEGKDDPRLVAFATTLARARFIVLVPDFPSLRDLRVNSGNIGEVSDVFSWLVARRALAPRRRAGIIAFSYAVGPVVLAAMHPSIRDRVRFILAVGGYYNLPQVLTFFTTGYFQKDGRWRHRTPNAYGKWVFVRGNVGRLSDPRDRKILRAMADRKIRDLAAPLKDLAEKLGPEGRRVYAFIANTDRKRASTLMAALPEPILRQIEALNLANKNLHELHARMILVHGIDDDIIPSPQSIALAKALRKGQARLFLANGLNHMDVEPGFFDKWRLWRAVDALLAERRR